jgi:hypothetical protein
VWYIGGHAQLVLLVCLVQQQLWGACAFTSHTQDLSRHG